MSDMKVQHEQKRLEKRAIDRDTEDVRTKNIEDRVSQQFISQIQISESFSRCIVAPFNILTERIILHIQ